MKKYLLSIAVLTMGVTLFTACVNNDDKEPTYWPVAVSDGAYVVCAGSEDNNVGSTLTYFDYVTGNATQRVFATNNGRELGKGANDGLVYGDKMYVVVSAENTVEVVDRKTLKSIRQIKLTELMGGGQGVMPRHIAADADMIYVSTYGSSQHSLGTDDKVTTSGNGYVVAIDTVSFALRRVYEAGSFPEGLAVSGDKLYVANSDYGAVNNASISVINLSSGADTPIKDELIAQPTKVAVAGPSVYVLDMGNGKTLEPGVRLISTDTQTSERKVSTRFEATCADFVGYNIYGCYNPTGTDAKYTVCNISQGYPLSFTSDGVFSPTAIAADPISDYVFIASCKRNAATGQPDYGSNGYVAVYDQKGYKLKEFDCGVGPIAFIFNTRVVYVKQ